jgi:hypothetical protein
MLGSVLALVGADTTPPVDPTIFQPLSDGVLAEISAIIPVAIPVFVGLAGIGIAIRLFGKFGVRK